MRCLVLKIVLFNKAGIGFQKGFPKKVKKFSNFFNHGSISSSSSVIVSIVWK